MSSALVAVLGAAGCGDNGVAPPDAVPDAPLTPAALTMSPPTSDFGTVTINTSSSASNFTVTNSGQETSGSISAIVSGAAASDFTVANSCSTLAGAGTCIVSVTFSPTAAGAKTATLIVSGSPGGTVMATLNGAAVNPGTLSLAPQGNQSFGNVIVGATGTFQTFTVMNTGGVTTGTLTVTPAGSDPNQFTKTNDTCNGMTLAATASCTFRVNFAPTSTGAKAATFIVAGQPGGSVTATVSGNGVEDANIVGNPMIGGFGSVTIGQSSNDVTFTFTNTGDLPTSALLAPVVAPTPEYTITSQNCTGVVLTPNGGNSCTVLVRFTPVAAGNRPGTLTVSATTGGTEVVNLSGTGNSVGSLSINESTFFYGNVTVGQTSNHTFTVTNTGGTAAGPLVATVSGEFTIVAGQDGCTGVVLSPLTGSCTIVVAFAPTSGGAEMGTLTVSGGAGSPGSSFLTGTGIVSANIASSDPSHDFGSVVLNTPSAPFTFTINNNGGVASSVPTVSVTGPNAGQFAANNMCTAAIPAGGNCTVTVTFTPTTVGAKTATLNVSITPGNTLALGLSGDGITNAQIVAAPSALPFNDTFVGDSSQQIFTVTNNGSVTTGPLTITETGTNQADFSQTNDCTTLANGQSCTVTVTFTPTAEGNRTNVFSVTGTPGGTTTVAVSGDGVPRIEVTDPTTNPYDFGTRSITATTPLSCRVVTFVNNTAQNQSFTLAFTNFQNIYPTNDTNATPDAPTADYFWRPTNGTILGSFQSCDQLTSLPPAGSTVLGIATDTCSIEVCFDPNEPGTQTGNVTMTVGAGGAANQASQDFTGVGTANALVITPCTGGNCTSAATPPFDFGDVNVGTTRTQDFTLTNQTGAATGTLETNLSGSFLEFHILNDNCAGTTLAINGQCTITVMFQPASTGPAAVTGTLTVRDIQSTSGSMAQRQLDGNGVDAADLVMTPGSFNFGTVFIGETSAAAGKSFVITNAGDENSGPLAISLTGNASFVRQTGAAGDCIPGTTIVGPVAGPVGSNIVTSCNVRVRFQPTTLHVNMQVQQATLTVSATPGGSEGVTDNLVGTSRSTVEVAYTPGIGDPLTPNFGNVVIGQVRDLPFRMVNNSTVQTVSFVSGMLLPGTEFTVVNATGCASVGPGQPCNFSVRFAPTGMPGVTRGPVTLTMNATNGSASLTGIFGTGQSVANLVLTPATADFGSVLSGTAASILSFRLTNTGFQSATGIVVSIPNAMGNYTQASDCSGTLAQNAFCTINVTFAPPLANTGVLNATLTVASTLGGAPTSALTGRGIANGEVRVTPATRNFGSAAIGQQSEQQIFSLLNTSAAAAATLSLTPPAEFVVDNTGVPGPLCTTTLAPVATCNIGVRFAPTSAGLKTGQFAFTAGTYAAVQGVGLSNTLITGLSPSDFQTVTINEDSAPVSYIITNGNVGPTGPLAVALGGANPGEFEFTGLNNCNSTNLAPGGTCTITVRFSPQPASGFGPKTATLNVTSDAVGALGVPANGGISVSTTLTGNGANTADISISPAMTQAEGNRPVGQLDAAATVYTITNAAGSAPTGALLFSLSNNLDFVFTTTGLATPCVSGSTVLAGGGTCQIGVLYHPLDVGADSTTLTVSENDGVTADSVTGTITGTGTQQFTGPAGVTTLTPNANTTLTFRNNASVATNPLECDETFLGNQVSMITNNCVAQVLPAGGTCTVVLRYVPDGLNGPTNALFGCRSTVDVTSPPYGATLETDVSFACSPPSADPDPTGCSLDPTIPCPAFYCQFTP